MAQPDFLVIGTQKGGTTSLWYYLQQHPEIKPSATKELHYFDQASFKPNNLWYESHFSNDPSHITGEVTPIYCFYPNCIQHIFEYKPSMKLIFLLRDPVDRAISHYWMEYGRGAEKLRLFDAITQEKFRLTTDKGLRTYSYALRGHYAEQIQRIYQFFPKNQLFLLDSYHLRDNTQKSLRTITDFIGATPYSFDVTKRYFQTDKGANDERAVEWLKDYFLPLNRQLEDDFGFDTSLWK